MLAVPFSSYAASSVKAAVPEQAASIPTYQWQFLSAPEKAAVDASLKVIMNERFKNITVNIADPSGTPYTGTVRVKQDFTVFMNAAGWPDGDDYLAMTPSRTYSIIADWSRLEFAEGTFYFDSIEQELAGAAWMGATNVHLNIGPHFSICPGCPSLPDWAKTLEYDSLKSAIKEYDEALVSHFKGRIQYYQIWWEANADYGNANWPLDHIIDIIKTEAVTIRAIDPNAQIIIDLANFPNPGPNNWSVEYFVQAMLSAGVPFDIIGLEMHIGVGTSMAVGGIDTLYDRLNVLAKFGKPLYVWEDGLPSSIDPGSLPSWMSVQWMWHGEPSEEKQAEWMVAETLVYLGNPSVLGVQWWALQDYSTDHLHMGVISYPDGAKKKSFHALEQLWNSLMVNETVQSINGVATFRGLAGNYSISVQGYEPATVPIQVAEDKPNTFRLVLTSQAMINQASQLLSSAMSNITGANGATFQSSEAKKLLNQSWSEYYTGLQMYLSREYAGALRHGQNAIDLIHQAQLAENQYRQQQKEEQQQQQLRQQQQLQQQLLTRIVEVVVVVAVAGGCAVAAVSYLRRRKPSPIR
jgi:hypothetical protein